MSDIFPGGFLSYSNTEENCTNIYGRDLAELVDMAQALVIDDEENILNILRTLLVKLDFDVKVARDGKEGIELFEDGHDFDLVITDIRMPRMDGNQVAECIRGSGKADIPIVAISGYSKEIDESLFDFLLWKHFGIETIVNLFEELKRERRIC